MVGLISARHLRASQTDASTCQACGSPEPKETPGGLPVGQTLGEPPVIRLRTEDGTPFPLLPAAEAEYKERMRRGDQGPSSRCMPHTVVDAYLVPEPIKIVHTAGLTILLQE